MLHTLRRFLCETPRAPAAVRGIQAKPPHPALCTRVRRFGGICPEWCGTLRTQERFALHVRRCPAGSAASGAASSAGAAGVSVCDAAAVSGAGTSGWGSSAAADGARQSRAPNASESANILHLIALSPFHKNSYYYNMHGGDGMQAPPPFFGGVNKNRKNSLGRITNFELRVCCKITKRNLTRPEWPAGRLPGWRWA